MTIKTDGEQTVSNPKPRVLGEGYGNSNSYLASGGSLSYQEAHAEVDRIHDAELRMYREGNCGLSEYETVWIAKSRLAMHLSVDRSFSLDIAAISLARDTRRR